MNYKSWIFVAILLFVASMLTGWAMPGSTTNLLAEDLAALQDLASMLASLPAAALAFFIFAKNAVALLLSFVLSPILCLMPLLALTANGAIIGLVSARVIEQESLGFLLAGLLPHGIFELPAFIMGEAAALSFGTVAIILIVKRESRAVLVSTVKQDVGHILLALALFFVVGIFHTIIIVALLQKQTKDVVMANLNRNFRYLMIALGLLIPAALIEAFITPLLLGID